MDRGSETRIAIEIVIATEIVTENVTENVIVIGTEIEIVIGNGIEIVIVIETAIAIDRLSFPPEAAAQS